MGDTTPSKLELLVVRHPDGGITEQLYVDGLTVPDYTVEVVDAGVGAELGEWRLYREALLRNEQLSPAFVDAIVAYRDDAEARWPQHIIGNREEG